MNRHTIRGRGSIIPPPEIGEVIVLCFGICEGCGWWAAMPEGSLWPRCPVCGEDPDLVKPARATSFDPAEYPNGEVPLGFLAQLHTEFDAINLRRQAQGKPPMELPKRRRFERLLAGLMGNR